jgi:hypothetical protein
MPDGGKTGVYSEWMSDPRWETFHQELPSLLSDVSTRGAAASAVLRAIQSLIEHDRLEPGHDAETETTDLELIEEVQRR